jgi:hypothetical protein
MKENDLLPQSSTDSYKPEHGSDVPDHGNDREPAEHEGSGRKTWDMFV